MNDMVKKEISQAKSKTMWGCKIEPYFFSHNFMNEESLPKRILPFIPDSHLQELSVFCSEVDRKNFKSGCIAAQPDIVISHKDYDIVVEFKSNAGSKKKIDQSNWIHQIKLRDILQVLICSLQVSNEKNKAALSVLRYMECAFVIYPSPELITFILNEAPKVHKYKQVGNDKYVAASILAEQLEIDIKKQFGTSNENAREKGKIIHEKMLQNT